jgi:hypothetical protein
MEICKHYIAEGEIIGIGPLMTERKLDPHFPAISYWFYVYTKSQAIKIQSDTIQTGEFYQDKIDQGKQYLKDFTKEFDRVKENILLMID